jgi:hypothetical protein
VQSAANTVVAWMPRHTHGTSLQDRLLDGADPDFSQTGVSFVTSTRIPGVWRRYQDGLVSQEAIESELEQESHAADIPVNK